jgi:chromosome segregation ATPase
MKGLADRLFDEFCDTQKVNTGERQKSLKMEGDVSLHIHKAQKEASDYLFEYDTTCHQGTLLKQTAHEWEQTLADLAERLGQTQIEIRRLTEQEKSLLEENQRLNQELRSRQSTATIKELQHRLELVKASRDEKLAEIQHIQEQQVAPRKEIEELDLLVEDLTDRRDCADEEVAMLVEQSKHRHRQLRAFDALIRSGSFTLKTTSFFFIFFSVFFLSLQKISLLN